MDCFNPSIIGLALIRDTLSLQRLAFGLGFRLFHLQNLFRFAAGAGCNLLALCSVNLVHRRFHFFVGLDIGDESLVDGVTVGCITSSSPCLMATAMSDCAETHRRESFRHMAENDIEYVRRNLLLRVRELVKSS